MLLLWGGKICRTVCKCTDDAKTKPMTPFSSIDKGEFLRTPNTGCILVQVTQEAAAKPWENFIRENACERKREGAGEASDRGAGLTPREREGKEGDWLQAPENTVQF